MIAIVTQHTNATTEFLTVIEGMHNFTCPKNRCIFSKKLNSGWAVDLKHKSLEGKEVTKILGHQGLPKQVR